MSPRKGAPFSIALLLGVALSACGASAQDPSASSSTSHASRSTAAARVPSAVGATASAEARGTAEAANVPGAGGVPGPPCGSAGAGVLAATAGAVAKRIYAGELAGSETLSDKRQVEGYAPLLAAVASGNRAAVKRAVESLVYSHTHLVRLRVTQGSTVLSDVGGPYILAPVSGTLRFHGRAVARYVMSVQDDLGYVKLVTRFVGAPIVLRVGARTIPVEGVFSPAPARIPDRGAVTFEGRTFAAYSFDATAFPSGPLRISLLLPVSPALAHASCAEVKTAELGLVAERISRRFRLSPASLPAYTRLTRTLTGGGLVYARSGSRQLAGSTSPGPLRLPDRGSVKYRGRTYGVSSFSTDSSVGGIRVYLLVAS